MRTVIFILRLGALDLMMLVYDESLIISLL